MIRLYFFLFPPRSFLKVSSFNTSTFSKLFNQLDMIIYEFIFGIAHVNKDFLMLNKYF